MASEPPLLESSPSPLLLPHYRAVSEKYADYTIFMQDIARQYEEARQNFDNKSLIFLVEPNGNSFAVALPYEQPESTDIQNQIKTTRSSAQLALVLSLGRNLDEQLEENGIDPASQYDWPNKPVNCTRPPVKPLFADLSYPSEATHHPDVRLPRLKRDKDAHVTLAVQFLEHFNGIVDGGLDHDTPRPPRSIHARLEDAAGEFFSEVPTSLRHTKQYFDEAFADGYPLILAFISNDGEVTCARYKSPDVSSIAIRERREHTSDKLFLALSTKCDFMQQIRAANPSYISPKQASHHPIITPGIFPDVPPQPKIAASLPQPSEWR